MKTIYGVIKSKREFKWGGFATLETFRNKLQCVFKNIEAFATLKPESYVKLSGVYADAKVNQSLVISVMEFVVSEVEVLSEPTDSSSIDIAQREMTVSLPTELDNRAWTLRNERNKCIFKIQSAIHQVFRNELDEQDFISISTPKIVSNGAEGGTNVFTLDYFGQEASLAQSPQLYKQMMCGALGRVYETGSVFRAEPHATTRHLNEYTSLDFEMVIENNLMEIIVMEYNILSAIMTYLGTHLEHQLTYIYGERPNLALGQPEILTVQRIKEILDTTGNDLTGEEEREIAAWAKTNSNTDLVFATHFHRDVRPFYSKVSENGITTETFDCIYKGVEITSGGQRAETYAEYQSAMAEKGIKEEQFEGYLQAFKLGMPLHGGCAIGLERLTQNICGLDNIKQATLFPRDNNRLKP